MDSVGSAIRWLAVDNPLSRGLISGISSTTNAGFTAAKQLGGGSAVPVAMPAPAAPVRWLITPGGRMALRTAGVSGALAVILGAYGAHKLHNRDNIDPELYQVFEKANRYHMFHSLALLGAPLCRSPVLVTLLLSSGIALFSGAAYVYVLTGNSQVRALMPYGGMLFIAGWLSMAI